MSKRGVALLTAKRPPLLNGMLLSIRMFQKHIKMFIGLKLDMETIPNAEFMNKDSNNSKITLPRCFFSTIHHCKALHVPLLWHRWK